MYYHKNIKLALILISICLASFACYNQILDYFFTTADSLSLIETSIIQSFDDVIKIFSKPMMHETGFISLASYYRPVSVFSYSLDYSIWKLDPFGYHLTDLILHTLVAITIFFLVRLLTGGKMSVAWLTALIFTTHPVIAEVVPGIARRQDIMTSLFMLLAIYSFLKSHNSRSFKHLFLVSSLLFYLLALGSKEAGILLLPLHFIYLMIFVRQRNFMHTVIHSIKKCLPFIILTSAFLLLRMYILGGIGGQVGLPGKTLGVSTVIQSAVKIIVIYFVNLIYAIDYHVSNLIFNFSISNFISILALICIFFILYFYGKDFFKTTNNNSASIMIKIKIILLLTIIISLIGFAASNYISPLVNRIISDTHLHEKLKLIKHAMEIRYSIPENSDLINSIVRIVFFVMFSVSTLIFLITHNLKSIMIYFLDSDQGKLSIFFLIWMVLPLGLYLPTLTFTQPNMYGPIIPFCALMSFTLINNIQHLYIQAKNHELLNRQSLFIVFTVTLILLSNLSYSPLIRSYKDWESASNLYKIFFHNLAEVIPDAQNDSSILVFNLPQRIFSSSDKIPRVQTASYLNDYTIKSWINLNYPENNIEVTAVDRGGIYTNISDIRTEITIDGKTVTITINGNRILN